MFVCSVYCLYTVAYMAMDFLNKTTQSFTAHFQNMIILSYYDESMHILQANFIHQHPQIQVSPVSNLLQPHTFQRSNFSFQS